MRTIQTPALAAMRAETSMQAPVARARRMVTPFTPAGSSGGYTLPKSIQDQLASSLASLRNRDAAFALAVFLARYWTAPSRIDRSFPVDRQAISGRAVSLDLSEARVRGAILALERIGFLIRAEPAPGSRYQRTPSGIRCKPVLWQFGPEYLPGFLAANRRRRQEAALQSPKQAQDGHLVRRLPSGASGFSRPLAGPLRPFPSNSPTSKPKVHPPKGVASLVVSTKEGYREESLPAQTEGKTGLEAALALLGAGVLGDAVKDRLIDEG